MTSSFKREVLNVCSGTRWVNSAHKNLGEAGGGFKMKGRNHFVRDDRRCSQKQERLDLGVIKLQKWLLFWEECSSGETHTSYEAFSSTLNVSLKAVRFFQFQILFAVGQVVTFAYKWENERQGRKYKRATNLTKNKERVECNDDFAHTEL